MKKEILKKIHEALIKQFNADSRIYDFTEDSFKYERSENGRINLWQVNYSKDGNRLHVDWEKAWIVRPPSFNGPVGDAKISMDGT